MHYMFHMTCTVPSRLLDVHVTTSHVLKNTQETQEQALLYSLFFRVHHDGVFFLFYSYIVCISVCTFVQVHNCTTWYMYVWLY